jgi:hypothetical protein
VPPDVQIVVREDDTEVGVALEGTDCGRQEVWKPNVIVVEKTDERRASEAKDASHVGDGPRGTRVCVVSDARIVKGADDGSTALGVVGDDELEVRERLREDALYRLDKQVSGAVGRPDAHRNGGCAAIGRCSRWHG